MANLSRSERELTGVSLSGGICTLCGQCGDPLRVEVKDKHTPVELESRPLSRLKVACWKGRRVDIFHFHFHHIFIFFAFPALPNDIKVSSASVESWCIQQVMPKTAICFETETEIRGQDVFLKSASLVRAKLHCWVSKIPGSHLLKEYSSRHIF